MDAGTVPGTDLPPQMRGPPPAAAAGLGTPASRQRQRASGQLALTRRCGEPSACPLSPSAPQAVLRGPARLERCPVREKGAVVRAKRPQGGFRSVAARCCDASLRHTNDHVTALASAAILRHTYVTDATGVFKRTARATLTELHRRRQK